MKIHLPRDGGVVLGVEYRAQRERPGAGKNGAANRNGVADFPAEFIGQLAAHRSTLAVALEGDQLIGRHDKFRVEIEEIFVIDRKLRKEISRLLINATEPIQESDRLHAIDRAHPFAIVDRHRKHQRDRIARDQARSRRRIGAREPGVDHRLQQTEGNDRDNETDDRQARTQLGAEYILEYELEVVHVRQSPAR